LRRVCLGTPTTRQRDEYGQEKESTHIYVF
jgi:hypothetical protein